MPTFVDMTGFPDEQSNHILDLLDMVFSGRIRENQKMADIGHLPSGALNNMNKRVTRRSIDRIIVVSTLDPDSPLPADLMCSIVKAARKNRGMYIQLSRLEIERVTIMTFAVQNRQYLIRDIPF